MTGTTSHPTRGVRTRHLIEIDADTEVPVRGGGDDDDANVTVVAEVQLRLGQRVHHCSIVRVARLGPGPA